MKSHAKSLLLLASLVTASAAHAGKDARSQDIVDTAIAAGSFQTLAKALTAAGLVETLRGEGPFTVFAPTDEAFAKLPAADVKALLAPGNRDRLVAILTYHVVSGKLNAAKVSKLETVTSLNGQRLAIEAGRGAVKVGPASVTAADVKASNGVIHVIDTVLLPETDTIVGVAKRAGTFETLLAAAGAGGLDGVLSGKGPFTVFAPTDDAFAKLPKGTVESLLLEENRGRLRKILEYHVVSGRVFSDEVLRRGELETVAGLEVTVSSKSGTARVNESALVATDVQAANGVIHVIDTVLLPPEAHSSAAL